MKVIILAGGLGTRISEETENKPKPMILLNGKPVLWHLMNIFANQGFTDFMIAGGYKGEVIKEWLKFDQSNWNIDLLDTGLETQTGGRIKKCLSTMAPQRVIVTYGDGLGNINLRKLISFHEHHKKLATVTAVRPPSRFGVLEINNGKVEHFGEKLQTDAGWINGGFFVLEPKVIDYLLNDSDPFELGPLPRLVETEQLMAFEHGGFWQPMDTLREKNELEKLAKLTLPPWLVPNE
jgi:glucose-1-phosphate cytidylyltransferase